MVRTVQRYCGTENHCGTAKSSVPAAPAYLRSSAHENPQCVTNYYEL